MGWFMSGRKVGKRKFSWKYRKTTEIIGKVTVSLSLTNIVVWVLILKTPCLIYFPSIKFRFAEETQKTWVALQRWRKLLQHLGTKDGEKIFFKFLTPTRTWKCTRSTMQISFLYASAFPFKLKLKLLQTWQTGRKNKILETIESRNWLWLSIVHCSEKLIN